MSKIKTIDFERSDARDNRIIDAEFDDRLK